MNLNVSICVNVSVEQSCYSLEQLFVAISYDFVIICDEMRCTKYNPLVYSWKA